MPEKRPSRLTSATDFTGTMSAAFPYRCCEFFDAPGMLAFRCGSRYPEITDTGPPTSSRYSSSPRTSSRLTLIQPSPLDLNSLKLKLGEQLQRCRTDFRNASWVLTPAKPSTRSRQ